MHTNIFNKGKLKLFNTADSDLAARISILENNVYKVTYYEIISGASGTLTVPTGATINADEFSGADCVLSEIDINNKPTWVSPKDAGGTVVTATLNTGTGAWVKSGVTVSANVALIYSLNIKAIDYANLNNFYIIDEVVLGDFNYVLNNSTNNSVTSALLAQKMSDETGTGALVFGTSPTFTTDITTPLIIGGTAVGSTIQYKGTSGNGTSTVAAHQFLVGNNGATIAAQIFNSGQVSIGNYANPTTQRLVTIGQDTAWLTMGSYTIATGNFAIYGNQATPSGTNYALLFNSSETRLNAPGTGASNELKLQLGSNTVGYFSAPYGTIFTGGITSSQVSGAITAFTFNKPNSTNQQSGTAIRGVYFDLGQRTWLAGSISAQVEFELSSPTYNFSSSSTVARATTFKVTAPTLGSNAIFTRSFAAEFDGNILITNNKTISGIDSTSTIRDIITWSSGDNITLSGRPGTTDIVLNPTSGGVGLYVKSNGDGGIGVASPVARWHVIKTTEQLRVGYDTSNYVSFTVNSSGQLSISSSGAANVLNFSNSLYVNNVSYDAKLTFLRTGGNTFSIQHTSNRIYWYNNSTTSEFLSFYNSGQVSIGNYASPTAQRLLTIGQDTAWLTIGSDIATGQTIRFFANQSTPAATNFSFDFNQTDTTINAPSSSGSLVFQIANSSRGLITNYRASFGFAADTSGAVTSFNVNIGAHTGQTASTEISNFKVNGASKTWAAGAITTQRWNYFTANTAAFASASTITYSYGLYVESAIAGSNATITTNIGIGTDGNLLSAGNYHWQGTSTPTTTNYTSYKDSATAIFNGGDNVSLSNNGTAYFDIRRGGYTSGTRSGFTFSLGSNTGQTASTEISGYLYNSYSRQWATGAITTQREHYLKTVTYSFVGASTITNAYGLYVEAATAGTNATITNNYAAGFSGNINIIGTPYVSGVAGVDGTFTTADAKTVTVTKGIITSIV